MAENIGNSGHDEIIRRIRSEQGTAGWRPVSGIETEDLIALLSSELSVENRRRLREEALSILANCTPPPPYAVEGGRTGLVVGFVQSGKTMSFTVVTALARDNNYPIVIVIAGTSRILADQSKRRLLRDLRLDDRTDRKWCHFHNPKGAQDTQAIENILADWRDPRVPVDERQTILITIMKHHSRLDNLNVVLSGVDLESLPVLIFDDEADQASLNNRVRRGDESTTYSRLRTLKDSIPHHTFLEYTATPQGPLLINLIDVLSPSFAVPLSPGEGYVGGREIFFRRPDIVEAIPTRDIPTDEQPLVEPPESLLRALRYYFLGVAAGLVRDHGHGNRSMMIHSSRETEGHQQFFNWVVSTRETWLNILQNPSDPDYAELIEDYRNEYNGLRRTVPDIEEFDGLTQQLLRAIRRTLIYAVNARPGRTPIINWNRAYSNILVGGQALDRGFTVEGLTVTYMPRGVGVGNADTIQQRGRFFGYKQNYIGFCRIYLEAAVIDFFQRYVEHEESVRRQLIEHLSSGRPFSELRRVFLLDGNLKPTRDSIIDINYVRNSFRDRWFYPSAPHDSTSAVENNRSIIHHFIQSLALTTDRGHPERTNIQRHGVAEGVPLRQVYDNLLLRLRFTRFSDAQDILGMLVVIGHHLSNEPNATCSIYQMSEGSQRMRAIDDNGEILNLFQGESPVNPPERRGTIYPGDRQIHSPSDITIQIHNLAIRSSGGQLVRADVPTIAIWVPSHIAGDIIIQDQGNLGIADV